MKHTENETGTPRQPKNGGKKVFSTRQFRRGGYATLACALALVLVLAVNLVVGQLPASVRSVDLTDSGLYSIGEQTKTLVSSLQEPVTIYLIASSGNEDSVIQQMLEKYAALSSQITLQTIDPVQSPKFVTQYTSESLNQNSVIVESAKRFKVIDYSSIYVTDYQYTSDYSDYTTTTTYDGEGQLTGALDYVTSDELPVAYYLTGHGEPGLNSDLKAKIQEQNITVEDLTLVNADALPEDCATLIIDSPTTDLYDGEADLILDYLAAGGKMVLLTNYTDTAMPNLTSVTDAYYVSTQPGVVLENDRSYYYQYPYYLLPEISNHTITGTLAQNNLYVLYYLAQGLVTDVAAKPENETVTTLLSTSDNCYSKLDPNNAQTLEQADTDPVGPFDLGVLIETAVDDDTTTSIVWYTTGHLLNSQLDSWVSGNNSTLFVNTLGYLCEHENAISIEGKSVSQDTLLLTTAQAGAWKSVYLVVLPLATLALGIVVFVRRRRKQ